MKCFIPLFALVLLLVLLRLRAVPDIDWRVQTLFVFIAIIATLLCREYHRRKRIKDLRNNGPHDLSIDAKTLQ